MLVADDELVVPEDEFAYCVIFCSGVSWVFVVVDFDGVSVVFVLFDHVTVLLGCEMVREVLSRLNVASIVAGTRTRS